MSHYSSIAHSSRQNSMAPPASRPPYQRNRWNNSIVRNGSKYDIDRRAQQGNRANPSTLSIEASPFYPAPLSHPCYTDERNRRSNSIIVRNESTSKSDPIRQSQSEKHVKFSKPTEEDVTYHRPCHPPFPPRPHNTYHQRKRWDIAPSPPPRRPHIPPLPRIRRSRWDAVPPQPLPSSMTKPVANTLRNGVASGSVPDQGGQLRHDTRQSKLTVGAKRHRSSEHLHDLAQCRTTNCDTNDENAGIRSQESTHSPLSSAADVDTSQGSFKLQANSEASNLHALGTRSITRNNVMPSQRKKKPRTAVSLPDTTMPAPPSQQDIAEAAVPRIRRKDEPPTTHAILCIDSSRSMEKRDVTKMEKNQNQKKVVKVTRWQAVFSCAEMFVSEQLEQLTSDDDSSNVEGGGLEVSLVVFDDKASTVFERLPLGDGKKIRERLASTCKHTKPKGGTGFSSAFQMVRNLASGSRGQVLVLFLSDGRPGDLHDRPPKKGEPMPRTYGKKRFPSAGTHIERMRAKHGDRLSLQMVCIHDDGIPWVRYLAEQYNGAFHMSNLSLDDDDKAAPPTASAESPDAAAHNNTEVAEVELVGSKSAATMLRDRLSAARASNQVLEITDTTKRSSTMRFTFRAISSVLTGMRTSATTSGLQERQGVVLESISGITSAKVKYEATRMVLHSSQDKFELPNGEKPNGRIVRLSTQPFAQGGLRNVYFMEELPSPGSSSLSMKLLVAKESRHEVPYKERLAFHRETVKCQARAADLALAFNAKLRRVKKVAKKCPSDKSSKLMIRIPPLRFLSADVYRLKDPSFPGGFRYLAVEERLEGKYEKFNSNNGYIVANRSGTVEEEIRIGTAQAFSHFSFEESGGTEMVVDIQGSGFKYTDPQLHSKALEYGRADRGGRGIAEFFRTHKCGDYCRALGLTDRQPIELEED